MEVSISFFMLLFLVVMLFLAGFVDASAGGGGLISLPAYLAAGLPIHVAYGTNKFTSTSGTTLATLRYLKSGIIDLRVAVVAAAASFLGSSIGSHLVLLISAEFLNSMLLAVLPFVAAFLLLRKPGADQLAEPQAATPKRLILAGVIGMSIGMYDALFGPGTGTFALIAFNVFMGYDLRYSNGNAKVLNLASNVASLITYWMAGNILFLVAIPCAAANILGAYFGSRLVLTKGAGFVRPMMTVVIVLLMLKVAQTLFFPGL